MKVSSVMPDLLEGQKRGGETNMERNGTGRNAVVGSQLSQDKVVPITSFIRLALGPESQQNSCRKLFTSLSDIVDGGVKELLTAGIKKQLETLKLEEIDSQATVINEEVQELIKQVEKAKRNLSEQQEVFEKVLGSDEARNINPTVEVLKERMWNIKKSIKDQDAQQDPDPDCTPEAIDNLLSIHGDFKKRHADLTKQLNSLSLNGSLPCSYSKAKLKFLERQEYLSRLIDEVATLGDFSITNSSVSMSNSIFE